MILITSDLHFNDKARDSYRHDYVNTIASEINKNKVDKLFILGDLTDEKDRHSSWLVNQVFDHIGFLSKLCTVWILPGNHDYVNPDHPFFAGFRWVPNVVWVNGLTTCTINGRSALFIPHNYRGDWPANLKEYDFVFTHQTFKGAKSESGQELDGIPPSVFSKKQTVISGDVHVPQKVGPVEYVGSPYPIDFGDDLDKHMMLIDERGKISYIPYEGPRKIQVDLPLGVPFRVEGLQEGDIVKVRVSLKPDEFAKFQEYKEQLALRFQELGAVLHMVQPVFDRGGPVQTRRRLRKRTDEDVLKAYATATKVKEPVVKTGLRILGKV